MRGIIIKPGTKITQKENLPTEIQNIIILNGLKPLRLDLTENEVLYGFFVDPSGTVFASRTETPNDLQHVVYIHPADLQVKDLEVMEWKKIAADTDGFNELITDTIAICDAMKVPAELILNQAGTPAEQVRSMLMGMQRQIYDKIDQVIEATSTEGKPIKYRIVSIEVVEPQDQCGFSTNYINLSVGFQKVREVDDIEITEISLQPDGNHGMGFRIKDH